MAIGEDSSLLTILRQLTAQQQGQDVTLGVSQADRVAIFWAIDRKIPEAIRKGKQSAQVMDMSPGLGLAERYAGRVEEWVQDMREQVRLGTFMTQTDRRGNPLRTAALLEDVGWRNCRLYRDGGCYVMIDHVEVTRPRMVISWVLDGQDPVAEYLSGHWPGRVAEPELITVIRRPVWIDTLGWGHLPQLDGHRLYSGHGAEAKIDKADLTDGDLTGSPMGEDDPEAPPKKRGRPRKKLVPAL